MLSAAVDPPSCSLTIHSFTRLPLNTAQQPNLPYHPTYTACESQLSTAHSLARRFPCSERATTSLRFPTSHLVNSALQRLVNLVTHPLLPSLSLLHLLSSQLIPTQPISWHTTSTTAPTPPHAPHLPPCSPDHGSDALWLSHLTQHGVSNTPSSNYSCCPNPIGAAVVVFGPEINRRPPSSSIFGHGRGAPPHTRRCRVTDPFPSAFSSLYLVLNRLRNPRFPRRSHGAQTITSRTPRRGEASAFEHGQPAQPPDPTHHADSQRRHSRRRTDFGRVRSSHGFTFFPRRQLVRCRRRRDSSRKRARDDGWGRREPAEESKLEEYEEWEEQLDQRQCHQYQRSWFRHNLGRYQAESDPTLQPPVSRRAHHNCHRRWYVYDGRDEQFDFMY